MDFTIVIGCVSQLLGGYKKKSYWHYYLTEKLHPKYITTPPKKNEPLNEPT